ncbi:DMT family transporter [Tropicimonas sp. TH_r6]|uniref:DMT family transporter n=1 Tax=Tropicimonas sp. TH_r6 TaxID=3082085 RepID=UPI0029556A2A|nr:DMT family transporter [Tropicimonas sp. TH_r6]MDV7143559.1 DMT family transporter [Tropicimonas sp. TH_r6]
MRLFLLTALTMVAFAANSLLNRLALSDGLIGPGGFATLRVASGACVLVLLLALRDRSLPSPPRPNPAAIGGLSLYMLGFSYAYVSMDAGLGALVLFGTVQITMFFGALLEGDHPPLRRWIGMGLAFSGLMVVSLPTAPVSVAPLALLLMTGAGLGWGIYSLVGRKVSDPLRATGWNFAYSLPLVAAILLFWPDEAAPHAGGVALALLSGGLTSALGYALWYALLPALGATRGALAQLSAPAIALLLGALFLGEQITSAATLSAGMILGGIAIGVFPGRSRRD